MQYMGVDWDLSRSYAPLVECVLLKRLLKQFIILTLSLEDIRLLRLATKLHTIGMRCGKSHLLRGTVETEMSLSCGRPDSR